MIRPKFFAYSLAQLMLERIFHRLTSRCIHVTPCFSPTIHMLPGPVAVPTLNESAQCTAGFFMLEAVPILGRLTITIPVSDCKAYTYTPLIPQYSKYILNSTSH